MRVEGLGDIVKRIKEEVKRDRVIRKAALSLFAVQKKRIFAVVGSKDAKGAPLGRYSENYVKYTRKKHNRTGRNINLQLTGQMINDYKFLLLGKGGYGYGFHNSANAKKADWVQDTYDTIIFDDLTPDEDKKFDQLVDKELDAFIKRLIN